MLAALLLRRRQPTLGRPFRTPVPPLVQWLAVFVLPILGVLGLFSEAGSVDRVLAGALSVVAGVSVLARWSLGRLRRKETELGRLRAARRSNYG